MEVLCRPAGASWLDGSRVKTEDKREVNPGMVMNDIERGLGREWERGHDDD
jgi:palmitoyltransferase ZDHHC9/14/18